MTKTKKPNKNIIKELGFKDKDKKPLVGECLKCTLSHESISETLKEFFPECSNETLLKIHIYTEVTRNLRCLLGYK